MQGFGKRRDVAKPNLGSIIVPQSAVDSDSVHSLSQAVVDFVNHTIHTALFERTEFPVEAMQAFHVDYYLAQVNNGGHGQFAANSRWADFILEDIKLGLAGISFEPVSKLFSELVFFSTSEPTRFQTIMQGGGFGEIDPFIQRLDQQFYAGLNDDLAKAAKSWIASLECLLVLPDEQYRSVMSDLPSRNQAYGTRKGQREKLAANERAKDPIFQALQYLCFVTPPGAFFIRWTSGNPCTASSGEKGMRFTVETEQGTGNVYLFPRFGSVWLDIDDKPRVQIPIEMVQDHVKTATGDYLPAKLWA